MKLQALWQSRTGLFVLGSIFGYLLWILCDDFSPVAGSFAIGVGKSASGVVLVELGNRAAQIVMMLCGFSLRAIPFTVFFGVLFAVALRNSRHARFFVYSAFVISAAAVLVTVGLLQDIESMGGRTDEFWKTAELNLFQGIAIYGSYWLSFELSAALVRLASLKRQEIEASQ